jgi:spore maturation protein CgeB
LPATPDPALLQANLDANLAALAATGQERLLAWLDPRGPLGPGETPGGRGRATPARAAPARASEALVLEADDGAPILILGGLSQDSRRAPLKEAARILDAVPLGPRASLWLYGLGGPALLLEALDRLDRLDRPDRLDQSDRPAGSDRPASPDRSDPAPALSVYEPDPAVARAALSAADVSAALRSGRLAILSPELARLHPPDPARAALLAHPASVRRSPAHHEGLKRLLFGARSLRLDPDGRPSVLVIGPLSGGSAPMAAHLARAADGLGLRHALMDWPRGLHEASDRIRGASPGPGAAPGAAGELLAAAAREAAAAVQTFRPTLTLVLAQAPLDARGAGLVRDADPETTLAFWFVEDYRRFGYVAEVAAAYDLLLHIQGDLPGARLGPWGAPRAAYLPVAADEAAFAPGPPDPRFRALVSMMGAGYPNRRRILSDLAARWAASGRPADAFKIFGSGWSGAPGLRARLHEGGRRVSTEECALIYRSSDVNLNIHSGDGPGFDPAGAFVNPRTFEIAAAAGFQIVDHRPLMAGLFAGGELEIVASPGDLLEAVERALGDPDRRLAMAEAARSRVLSAHLYRHRLAAILALLGWEG